MKIEDVKHNHSLTDLLKVGLFTCLMLAPIASVAIRSAYVVVNKNAYQSYSDDLIENQVQITNGSQLQKGAIVQFNYEYYETQTYSNDYQFTNISLDLPTIFGNLYNSNYNYDYVSTRSDGYLYIRDSNIPNSSINRQIWGTTITNFAITYKAITSNTINVGHGSVLVYQYQYKNNKLDNVFEYSVSQLEQSQLFSWTQNTAIFTAVNAMSTQMGINMPAIPIILTYWLILTCVYIVIDIVLKLFTLITHMIGRKTT